MASEGSVRDIFFFTIDPKVALDLQIVNMLKVFGPINRYIIRHEL